MDRGKKCALVLGPAVVMMVALPLTARAASRSDSLPSESKWLSDVAPVAASLQDYLEHRLSDGGSDGIDRKGGVAGRGAGGERPAVVLDIDNTSLATHYDRGAPVEAILKATEYAHEHGAAVLFASYRDADDRDATTQELTSAGYTVDGLCLKPEGDSPGKAQVKLGCRKQYEAEGYTLVANVGNRSTDFEGGHYEKGFKLPDYDGQLS
ncbi:HAD family acid phosphatase [Streptomyces sp. NPDC093707]|uniref:HAD family acid phosphatase n=1 Tax=Streptomyces sp. NPDC093707 TaxID=3154984 RepID=UPI00344BA84E